MRQLALLILVAGCKSEPVEVPPAPPRAELRADGPGPEQPGIAIEDKRNAPQIRPERLVLQPDQKVDPSEFLLHDGRQVRVPPEVSRLGKDAVAAYLDQLPPYFNARESYLRGYQLKATNPEEAAVFFRQVIANTPETDELHQKAKAQLKKLEH